MKFNNSFSVAKLLMLAVAGSFAFVAQTGTGANDVWHWLNPVPTGNPVNGISFLNGQFFTCSGRQIFTSVDGTNWITHLAPENVSLSRILFGNGQYVGIGSGPGIGVILTATNLDDWVFQTSATTNSLYAGAFGQGIFVLGGDGGTLLTSSDGVNWITRDSGTTTSLRSIAFGNGAFVAGSGEIWGNTSVSVSSDATNWIRQNIGGTYIASVNFVNNRFYAGGWVTYPPYPTPYTKFYSSENGTNWFELSPTGYIGIRSVFAWEGKVYAETGSYPNGSNLGLIVTADGTNFSGVATTGFVGANVSAAFANGNGIVVSGGGVIQNSTDGTNWNTITQPIPLLTDIASDRSTYVGVGGGFALPSGSGSVGSGTIIASIEGAPFQSITPPVSSLLCRVLYGNGMFLAVGYNGTVLRSTNGLQWVQRNSATSNHLRSICYANGLWIAVGDNGTIVTSPNGLTWTLRFSGTSSALNGVAYYAGQYAVAGAMGTILTSPDATAWTTQDSGTLETLFDITTGDGKFVAVGASGTIITSTDGINWNTKNSGVVDRLHAVAYNQGIFKAAGCPDDVSNANVLIVSTNISDWTLEDAGSSFRFYGLRSLNGTFVLAGDHGTLLQEVSPKTVQISGKWDQSLGSFVVSARNGLGQSFSIESCDSLSQTNWTSQAMFTNASSPALFLDFGSSSQQMRFYRSAK